MGRVAPALAAMFLLPSLLASPIPALHAEANRVPGPAAQMAPGKNATLADLAWLDGRWHGDWGPRIAEQTWMAPRAGLMLGTFRLVEDGKTLLLELVTLLQQPGTIEFRFRHFTPDLAPWEKTDATLLALDSFDATHFVFVNPVNGQPKRAIFIRVDQNTYTSRSEILPESGGTQVVEITYHREKPETSPTKPHE